jgi:succinoglycan biosynthesis protein ExoA
MFEETSVRSGHFGKPMVSVILAVRNESRAIESCLVSILAQKTESPASGAFDLEVLVVDGMSEDGTRAILERYATGDLRIRVLLNEKRRTPFAFNIGLRAARGEYVCIFGAHTIYRDDYIATCLNELILHNAAGCGGKVITVAAGCTCSAQLSAWAMSHPFGSSRKSFRTQCEGLVDTVNYPILRRDMVLAAGGYDEELTRNQDNDLNQKLRAAGRPLWCSWKTECIYFPKATVSGLLRYAYTNGFWNVLSLRKNPASMAVRHFVPLVFLLCLLAGATAAIAGMVSLQHNHYLAYALLASVLFLHLGAGTVSALQLAVRYKAPEALWMPVVFLGFHLAYGSGTLCGLLHEAWEGLLRSGHAQRKSALATTK